eukprot:6765341-Pyramimonas_sp.AAC.1
MNQPSPICIVDVDPLELAEWVERKTLVRPPPWADAPIVALLFDDRIALLGVLHSRNHAQNKLAPVERVPRCIALAQSRIAKSTAVSVGQMRLIKEAAGFAGFVDGAG